MKVALTSFVLGSSRVVAAGEIVADDDPAVEGREELFSAIVAGPVEQATKAPGERRPRRRL